VAATTYCSRCGTPNAGGAQFCSKCGSPLVVPGAAPLPPQQYDASIWAPPPDSDTLNAPEQKPTAAGVLSIIGGVFILLGGIAEIAVGSYVSSLTYAEGGGAIIGIGALGVIFGLIILVLGVRLLSNPDGNVTYGILILVFAFLSLVSFFGGFVIGFLLALIGGILALTWKPYGY